MSAITQMPRPLSATLGLAIFLTACTPNISVELYNNSGVPLLVTWCKGPFLSVPGAIVDLGSTYSCSNVVKVAGPTSSWRYPTVQALGSQYLHSDRFTLLNATLTIRLQINPDRRVFALPVGVTYPANEGTPQPPSFPLSAEPEA